MDGEDASDLIRRGVYRQFKGRRTSDGELVFDEYERCSEDNFHFVKTWSQEEFESACKKD